MQLKIHPSVGVARLGNSQEQFCLSPDAIGGLPYEADQYGNKLRPVIRFKDDAGQVRRQGQVFKIYDDETGNEITAADVKSMVWTVHLANKKAAWYQYSELQGNLLYGEGNSYKTKGVELRNKDIESETERKSLIVDPGPRSISGPKQGPIGFDANNVPPEYANHATFPNPDVEYGTPIITLGELRTDDQGRLIVLGGLGNAGGDEELVSYGGSDTWHDDISDGPVYCTVTLNDDTVIELQAWIIVGSPDFTPEIVNISNLSDSMFDVGVRHFDLVPDMYANGAFKTSFRPNYQRDILPIIQRLGRYQWVSNVQSMMAFTSNIFDFSDNSTTNRDNRMNYFSYFRAPNDKSNTSADQPQNTQLFRRNGTDIFPMMPLNSGSNSVSNDITVKFLALNDTQYFLMSQWAEGNFDTGAAQPYPGVDEKDTASVGNCVGLPMCPGIEVTWTLQNSTIYSAPYVISDQRGKGGYNDTGLTPSRDECRGGGCEPGDLTKRMACPWQADFFQCTIQYVNFTDPAVNKIKVDPDCDDAMEDCEMMPKPPNYYTYWWPPQSPWDVLTGDLTAEEQALGHLPAGQQVNYARGINSFVQMVEHWSAMAFIRDRNAEDPGFPYFTETERTHELFSYMEVETSDLTNNPEDNGTTIPVFFIEPEVPTIQKKSTRGKKLVKFLEKRAFKAIKVHKKGLGLPRSGTRSRR